ncbi:hypothetical protein BN381_160022 [Candidatus Microthrix parvicella RN1]|uniref:Uncharacterized protein n=1 Tax=Candidatus Neomicrothrix parvicella RN1 TaxID=1229780 RepID=R4Z388_9ACTN|nr:hypothetical protein BN381_160022 [Candidatus Microthrix parvicella RN1]
MRPLGGTKDDLLRAPHGETGFR